MTDIKDQSEFLFDDGRPKPKPKPEPEPTPPPKAPAAKKKANKKVDQKVDHRPAAVALQEGGPLQSLMDYNFIQYASYVICERAIPNLADGLKPVQRRILHALQEKDDGRFVKVANVVGHAMQYHPHGDASIADALVALTNRGFLIEGQGNFGNIYTGDRAAASRYIECRLTPLAREEIFNKPLTQYVPSYDGRNKEPVTLPAKLPLVLMLGAEGIAVGLATKILPHNFTELLEAQIAILQKKPFQVMPDCPQGGLMDVGEYNDGVGSVRVRAKIDTKKKDNILTITELPAATTTDSLIGSIEDAIRKNKVPVKAITDFTAEKVEIELTLASGTKPEKAIRALYAFTGCETKISSNIVMIHDKKPVELKVSEVLKELTRRLVELLEAELNQRKDDLEQEIHNKTLVQIFVENRIYKGIEDCKTSGAIEDAVLDGFIPFKKQLRRPIISPDVEMLLGVRIRRISLFDINKNKRDIEKMLAELTEVEKNLKQITRYAIRYLRRLLKQYGDDHPRRTIITAFDEIEVRELTATELELTYDREKGYFGSGTDGDAMLQCSSLDKILLVWDNGRYKVVTPPDRLFVDKNLIYCATFDRDQMFTLVYTLDDFTFMKRFTLGGAILDREYFCTTSEATVHLFDANNPADIFVKYKPAKAQRIHQQVFHPHDIPVKSARARGNHMTGKRIARLATSEPRWWKKDADDGHRGVLL